MSTHTDEQVPRIQAMEHWLIRCESCGTIDHTYTFPDLGSYGRIAGRTCSGELAEFSAWEDSVYEEVLGIVRTLVNESVSRLRECFHMVMSLVADPAPSGEQYTFTGRLCCRQCGSNANWYKPGEPDMEKIHLPLVTHREWERLGLEEKVKTVETGLRLFGCIG